MKKLLVPLIIAYAVIMFMFSSTVYAPEPPALKPLKKQFLKMIQSQSSDSPKTMILPEIKLSMPTIEPKPDIDYKILSLHVDPSADYKILTIGRTLKNTVKLPFRLPVIENNFKPDKLKVPTLKQFKGIQIPGLTVPQSKKK